VESIDRIKARKRWDDLNCHFKIGFQDVKYETMDFAMDLRNFTTQK